MDENAQNVSDDQNDNGTDRCDKVGMVVFVQHEADICHDASYLMIAI